MSQLILNIDPITGHATSKFGHQRFRVHYQDLDEAFKQEGATPGIQRVINTLLLSLKTPKKLSNEIIAQRSLTSVSTVHRAKNFLIKMNILEINQQGVYEVCKFAINWQNFIHFVSEKKINLIGRLKEYVTYWRDRLSANFAPTEITQSETPNHPVIAKNATSETQAVEPLPDTSLVCQNDTHLYINNIKLFMNTMVNFLNLDFSNFRLEKEPQPPSKKPLFVPPKKQYPLQIFLQDAENLLELEKVKETDIIRIHFKTAFSQKFQEDNFLMKQYVQKIAHSNKIMLELRPLSSEQVILRILDFGFMKHFENIQNFIANKGNNFNQDEKSYDNSTTERKNVKSYSNWDFDKAQSKSESPEQIRENRKILQDKNIASIKNVKIEGTNMTHEKGHQIMDLLTHIYKNNYNAIAFSKIHYDENDRWVNFYLPKGTHRWYREHIENNDMQGFHYHPFVKENKIRFFRVEIEI